MEGRSCKRVPGGRRAIQRISRGSSPALRPLHTDLPGWLYGHARWDWLSLGRKLERDLRHQITTVAATTITYAQEIERQAGGGEDQLFAPTLGSRRWNGLADFAIGLITFAMYAVIYFDTRWLSRKFCIFSLEAAIDWNIL